MAEEDGVAAPDGHSLHVLLLAADLFANDAKPTMRIGVNLDNGH
jgi:hypothetical protein